MVSFGCGTIEEKYYDNIFFITARECKYNKRKFLKELREEAGKNAKLLTKVQEGYYRIKRSSKGSWEENEFGDYYLGPCEKERGASLYYFAGFEYIRESE